MTTMGKYRHLMQCSTPSGHFTILALDHRKILRDRLDEQAGRAITDAEFVAFKQQLIEQLSAGASAVLADPAFGIGPGISAGLINGQMGLLAPVEVTDYDAHPSRGALKMIPGWDVEKIKRAGGTGVKMLVHHHPQADNAAEVRAQVEAVAAACVQHDIPFFPEPIPFSLNPVESLSSAEYTQAVLENARIFSGLAIDVLKTPFPVDVKQQPDEAVWREALAALDRACSVPWALLSAGVDFVTFKRQVELACAAGASGVIVGRAVWAEAVGLAGDEREVFLATTGRQRMEELAQICAQAARSWRVKVETPSAEAGWYI